jgi:hypothetical protein
MIPKFLNPARSKARVPGFDRVGRVNFYFKKNSKRRRFSKKKHKNQRVATGFLTGFFQVSRVTPDHGVYYFFINPFQFQPQIPGRPTRPGQVSKHCMIQWMLSIM